VNSPRFQLLHAAAPEGENAAKKVKTELEDTNHESQAVSAVAEGVAAPDVKVSTTTGAQTRQQGTHTSSGVLTELSNRPPAAMVVGFFQKRHLHVSGRHQHEAS